MKWEQRELKFRFWDGETMVDYLHVSNLGVSSGQDEWFDNIIVTQYTGLLDKNQKEIYDGDIVWHPVGKSVHIVLHGEWDNGQSYEDYEGGCGWYLQHRNMDENNVLGCEAIGGWEVIGNCFENPELLEEESE